MKRIISILSIAWILSFSMLNVNAAEALRVVDGADLLTDDEEMQLLQEVDEISERQQLDVVVVTTNSLGGKNITAYTEDFYDENGYGFGDTYDGVILLIDMETRQWKMVTTGFGITAFTDAGIDYIAEKFLPYLSGGEYYQAFSTYAKWCDTFTAQAKEGEAYDVSNMPKEAFPILSRLVVAALIGLVAGFIGVTILKGQMKSVKRQKNAGRYATAEGLRLHTQKDRFLYVHTDRERLPEPRAEGGKSGGSSVHVGSSGRTHGGGGGKF